MRSLLTSVLVFCVLNGHAQLIYNGSIGYSRSPLIGCTFPYAIHLILTCDQNIVLPDSASLNFGDGSVGYAVKTDSVVGIDTKTISYAASHYFPSCSLYSITYLNEQYPISAGNCSSVQPFFVQTIITNSYFLHNENSIDFEDPNVIKGIVGQDLNVALSAIELDGDSVSFSLADEAFSDCGIPNGVSVSDDGTFSWPDPTTSGTFAFFIRVDEWRDNVLIGTVYHTIQIIVELETGIYEMSRSEGITIYPNPATAQLTATTTHPIKTITLTDITGRVQLAKENHGSANTATLDVSALAKGVYIVGVLTQQGWAMERLVVQ